MAIDEARPAATLPAVEQAFDDWLEPIYGFVARRLQDRDAAEAVTARTFERAAESIASGRLTSDAIGGFLLRVAATATLDHARRQRRDLPSGARATDLDDAGDAEAALWLADAAAARTFAAAIDGIELRRAVTALDDQELRLVLLRYLDGLDADGIAAVLGCSVEAAALGLHRALATLYPDAPRSAAHVA